MIVAGKTREHQVKQLQRQPVGVGKDKVSLVVER